MQFGEQMSREKFQAAVKRGDIIDARYYWTFFRHNCSIEDNNESLLQVAVQNCDVQMARFLLATGHADAKFVNTNSVSLLSSATRRGLTEIARLLIEHGANVRYDDYQPLRMCCRFGDYPETILLLVESGVDGRIALQTVCHTGRLAALRALLDHRRWDESSTFNAICKAIEHGRAECLSEILSRGDGGRCRKITFLNTGATALDLAVTMAHRRRDKLAQYMSIVQSLVEHGWDPLRAAKTNTSPLQLAERYKLNELMEIFRKPLDEESCCGVYTEYGERDTSVAPGKENNAARPRSEVHGFQQHLLLSCSQCVRSSLRVQLTDLFGYLYLSLLMLVLAFLPGVY